jgi:glycosyltransferase involved in cell wall biosynthesis
MPKLSIITVNKDNADGLKKTIESIKLQIRDDCELIIIDGGSCDISVDILTYNSQNINYWISEPDHGIYEAMNKGIRKANGEYLLFLNSGDCFNDGSIIEKFVGSNPVEDIVAGDLIIKHIEDSDRLEIKKSPETITLKYLISDYLPHSGTFIKRSLFNKVGLYNENNKIVSDWEFFLKAFLIHNASYRHLPFPVSIFKTDGISCKPENADLIKNEKLKVLNESFPDLLKGYNYITETYDKSKENDLNIGSRYYRLLKKKCISPVYNIVNEIFIRVSNSYSKYSE